MCIEIFSMNKLAKLRKHVGHTSHQTASAQYTVSMKTSSYILILSIYGKNMAYHHHPPTNLSLLCCFSKKNYKRFRETYKENDILKFRLVCYFYFHHNYSALRNIIEQNCRTCSSCSKEKPRNKPTNPPVSAM